MYLTLILLRILVLRNQLDLQKQEQDGIFLNNLNFGGGAPWAGQLRLKVADDSTSKFPSVFETDGNLGALDPIGSK